MPKITEGKDAAGQDIKIGDMVIFIDAGQKILKEGYIMRFTPKGVSMSLTQGGDFHMNRTTEQVVKLPVELRLTRILGA